MFVKQVHLYIAVYEIYCWCSSGCFELDPRSCDISCLANRVSYWHLHKQWKRLVSEQCVAVCSAAKKKEQKKGVKTTQQALDEAKAAALEKEMESGDEKGKVLKNTHP